jgi:hypothetical protein
LIPGGFFGISGWFRPEFASSFFCSVECHSSREALARQEITLPHISTKNQTANVFTKALPHHRHQFLIDKLMIRHRPASI